MTTLAEYELTLSQGAQLSKTSLGSRTQGIVNLVRRSILAMVVASGGIGCSQNQEGDSKIEKPAEPQLVGTKQFDDLSQIRALEVLSQYKRSHPCPSFDGALSNKQGLDALVALGLSLDEQVQLRGQNRSGFSSIPTIVGGVRDMQVAAIQSSALASVSAAESGNETLQQIVRSNAQIEAAKWKFFGGLVGLGGTLVGGVIGRGESKTTAIIDSTTTGGAKLISAVKSSQADNQATVGADKRISIKGEKHSQAATLTSGNAQNFGANDFGSKGLAPLPPIPKGDFGLSINGERNSGEKLALSAQVLVKEVLYSGATDREAMVSAARIALESFADDQAADLESYDPKSVNAEEELFLHRSTNPCLESPLFVTQECSDYLSKERRLASERDRRFERAQQRRNDWLAEKNRAGRGLARGTPWLKRDL